MMTIASSELWAFPEFIVQDNDDDDDVKPPTSKRLKAVAAGATTTFSSKHVSKYIDCAVDYSNYEIVKNCVPNSRKGFSVLAHHKLFTERLVFCKEMRESINFGLDQLVANAFKVHNPLKLRGLNYLEKSRLVKSNTSMMILPGEADLGVVGSNRTDSFCWETGCMKGNAMSDPRFTHCIQRADRSLSKRNGMQSLISIIIFRVVLGVTNTNLSNVMVDEDLQLFSVNENGIGSYSADELLKTKPVVSMLNLIKNMNKYKLRQPRFEALLPGWFADEEERKEVEEAVRTMFKPYDFDSKTVEKVVGNVTKVRNLRNKIAKQVC